MQSPSYKNSYESRSQIGIIVAQIFACLQAVGVSRERETRNIPVSPENDHKGCEG